jgi:hypothetical protein
VGRVLENLPADAKVIPGHGRVSDVPTLRAYHRMLVTVRERVQEALKEDRDVEAMLSGGLLGEFDERWGQGSFVTPERFLTTVVESLSR